MAMEARCYRGDVNRTRMHELVLGRNDYAAAVVMVMFAGAITALRLIWNI